MLPDNVFDLQPYYPLTYNILMHEVLIPETVTNLIMEDLTVSRQVAVATMHDSQVFENTMHPLNDDSQHVLTARQMTCMVTPISICSNNTCKMPSMEEDLDEEEAWVKQEEIDAEFGASYLGVGNLNDPIDLTSD